MYDVPGDVVHLGDVAPLIEPSYLVAVGLDAPKSLLRVPNGSQKV